MKPLCEINTILEHDKSLTRIHDEQISAGGEHVFDRWPRPLKN